MIAMCAERLDLFGTPAVVLEAEEFRMRLGAVAELAQQLAEGNSMAARSARQLLQRRLERERDYLVRTAITKALQENWPAEAAQQVREERRAEPVPLAPRQKRRAEAARQAEEEQRRAEAARRRAAAAQPKYGGALTGPLWLVAPRTIWNIVRQIRQYLVAKAGRRLIIGTAVAGVCATLFTGILFYSDIRPNGLKAGLSDQPTTRELPDLEVTPSSRTGAPEVKPLPQTVTTIPPQSQATVAPRTAATTPPPAPTAPPPPAPTTLPLTSSMSRHRPHRQPRH
jgi:hypothetical protein